MTSRADILNALFKQLCTAQNFLTTSQRLDFWTNVTEQPALFTRYVGDVYPAYEVRGLPPARMHMKVQIWLYAKQDDVSDQAPPMIVTLAPLIDAVAAVLKPVGANTVQDLGLRGVVSHCWIEGEPIYDGGDLSGQVIAMIPVRIEIVTAPG